jgi:hypothetical protein
LIGFGSGIYDGHHHKLLLDLADFIFSTFGAPKFIANEEFIAKNHSILRERLKKKGFANRKYIVYR